MSRKIDGEHLVDAYTSVDDVLITEELERRPARAPDYKAENDALAAIAREMATNPHGVLHKLAELIIELCHADSAGISILESSSQNKLFRWHAVAGRFAFNLNETVARDASPCGVVISRNSVLLFNEQDRCFPAFRGIEPRIYEALLAPWTVHDQTIGTVWAIGHSSDKKFDAEDARLLQSLASFASATYQMVTALDMAHSHEQHLAQRVAESTRLWSESNERLRQEVEQRRQAEAVLLENQAQMKAALSIDTVGVLFFNLDGSIVDANPAFERMSGYSREELRTTARWDSLTPTEFMEVATKAADELASVGRTAPYEKQLIRKDGTRRWGLFAPTRLSGCGPASSCAEFVLDITESKQAQAKLTATEARLTAELDAMNRLYQLNMRLLAVHDIPSALDEVLDAAMILLDADMGNVQRYDPQKQGLEIVAQHGFRSEFLSQFRLVRLDDGTSCARALASGQRVIIEDVETDLGYAPLRAIAALAGYRSVQSTPLQTRDGEFLGVLSTHYCQPHRPSEHQLRILDLYAGQASHLIQRLRMEQALRESEARFRALADASPAWIWQLDAQGKAVYFNQRYLDLTGRTPEQLVEAGWHSIVHPDDLPGYLAAASEALRERLQFQQRVRVRIKDGNWHWLESYALPWYAANGEYRGHVGISIDVTDAVQAEEALKEAGRRKDEFLAMLAHELRNPLAPISNAVHLLKRIRDPSAASRLIEMTERQVSQIVRLVDDLLEVSRITRGKIELRKALVDLADIVHDAVETSKPSIDSARHQLTVSMPEEPLILEADKVRLIQVFANLLNNAAKYTNEGGRIWLTARRDGRQAEVSLRDSGIGIPAAMLAQIFDIFTQAHRSIGRGEGGLGIGLTMARSLVELHGGAIDAHSEGPGKGSEFIVRLPLFGDISKPDEENADPKGNVAMPLSGLRILVVDDNQDAADSLAMLLAADGADTQVAYDGAAALRVLDSYQPHAAIIDIGMPGMSGHEVVEQLRRQPRHAEIKLIALTGWGQEADRTRSRASGFDHHLTKPVDAAALEVLLASAREAGR